MSHPEFFYQRLGDLLFLLCTLLAVTSVIAFVVSRRAADSAQTTIHRRLVTALCGLLLGSAVTLLLTELLVDESGALVGSGFNLFVAFGLSYLWFRNGDAVPRSVAVLYAPLVFLPLLVLTGFEMVVDPPVAGWALVPDETTYRGLQLIGLFASLVVVPPIATNLHRSGLEPLTSYRRPVLAGVAVGMLAVPLVLLLAPSVPVGYTYPATPDEPARGTDASVRQYVRSYERVIAHRTLRSIDECRVALVGPDEARASLSGAGTSKPTQPANGGFSDEFEHLALASCGGHWGSRTKFASDYESTGALYGIDNDSTRRVQVDYPF
jgi:hypothetical protein